MTRAYRDASEPEGSMTNPSEAMIEAGEAAWREWENGGHGETLGECVQHIFAAMQQAAKPAAPVQSDVECPDCYQGVTFGISGHCDTCNSTGRLTPAVQDDDAERELAIIAEAFPPKPKCDADGKFRPGETLKEYFARNGTPADPAVIAEYERSMREDTIPAIERDLKANARAAHYLRLGVPDPRLTPDRLTPLVEALRSARPYVEQVARGEGTAAESVVAEATLAHIDTVLRDGGFDA